jgi:hypothetical protein
MIFFYLFAMSKFINNNWQYIINKLTTKISKPD